MSINVTPADLAVLINHNDLNEIKTLISENRINYDQLNLLWLQAVMQNRMNLIPYLTNQGANIHQNEEFALKLAIAEDRFDLVDFLVSHGANINIITRYPDSQYRFTPLVMSITYGDLQMTNYLLRHGADPNLEDGHALDLAVKKDRLDMVRLLVTSGAKIKPEMIEYAREFSDRDVLKFLLWITD